ncbi:hypothetical protein [Bdellovibrio bacteriovorus]|uniref:hypothetical protein n=1 Tax=Bdellovibrio bacteriovorus TaxID=959 RepID=UPI0035A70934
MEKDKSNIRRINNKAPKVEIVPHPEEILELDEETVAIARAKLAGLDFDEIYGDEDRTSPELIVKIQAQKIRDLFQTPEGLKLAFSSEEKIRGAYKDMIIDGIDLEFVKNYCNKKHLPTNNELDTLMNIAFNSSDHGGLNV